MLLEHDGCYYDVVGEQTIILLSFLSLTLEDCHWFAVSDIDCDRDLFQIEVDIDIDMEQHWLWTTVKNPKP